MLHFRQGHGQFVGWLADWIVVRKGAWLAAWQIGWLPASQQGGRSAWLAGRGLAPSCPPDVEPVTFS